MAILELENENLVFTSGKETALLRNINLKIENGDMVLVSGGNGTGKSTFFKAIFNFASENEKYAELRDGIFSFDGSKDVSHLNTKVIHISQEDYISTPFKKVYTALLEALPEEMSNKKQYLQNWIKKYIPFTKNDDSKDLLKRRVYRLSGGEKKFVAIVQGLVRCDIKTVKMALLDEPVNNLDAEHIIQLSDLLNRIKYYNPDFAMMLITHCHAFPSINKLYKIENETLIESEYQVHNCFGSFDEDGYYQSWMNPKNPPPPSL